MVFCGSEPVGRRRIRSLDRSWARLQRFRCLRETATGGHILKTKDKHRFAGFVSTPETNSAPPSRVEAGIGLTLERARALAQAAGFAEAGVVALPYDAEARDGERFTEW